MFTDAAFFYEKNNPCTNTPTHKGTNFKKKIELVIKDAFNKQQFNKEKKFLNQYRCSI